MGIVIDMKARRPSQAARPLAQQLSAKPFYYCMRCDSELFRILESGRVQCGRCSADIQKRGGVAAAMTGIALGGSLIVAGALVIGTN